jgi:hypothetical protein
MRLMPAQVAVHLICGESFPDEESVSLLDRIRRGHEMLVRMAGRDFGYDLQAWHDHLKESREGGYTYGRNIALPKIMQAALNSTAWQEAVRGLAKVP